MAHPAAAATTGSTARGSTGRTAKTSTEGATNRKLRRYNSLSESYRQQIDLHIRAIQRRRHGITAEIELAYGMSTSDVNRDIVVELRSDGEDDAKENMAKALIGLRGNLVLEESS